MNKIRLIILFLILSLIQAKPSLAGTASLRFEPSSINFDQNTVQTAQIYLAPQGNKVIGVDLFIRFDPQYIQVIDVINLGKFSSQTAKYIDNNTGLVKTAFSNGYNIFQVSPAYFAEIKFKGINTTNRTAITFDFITGKTTDTNVAIAQGQDALSSVEPLILTINTVNNPGPSSTPGPNVSPTPSPNSTSPNPSPLPSLRPRASPILKPIIDSISNFFQPKPTPISSPRPGSSPNQAGQVLGTTTNNWLNWQNGLLVLVGLLGIFVSIKLIRKFINSKNKQE